MTVTSTYNIKRKCGLTTFGKREAFQSVAFMQCHMRSLNKTFCSQNMGGISTVESEADHLSGGSTSEEQLANVSTFVIKSSVLMAAGNTTRGENPMFCADFPPNLLTLMPASPSPHAFSLRSFTVKASAGLTSGKSVGAVSKASALMLHTLA
ncbi:hypothetical protein MJT46_002979 [Ovis ammon polii x Ovis aries]|nr:hypothetical protein MJT46_002979 [Ovis ammon polii x Ovis aries]